MLLKSPISHPYATSFKFKITPVVYQVPSPDAPSTGPAEQPTTPTTSVPEITSPPTTIVAPKPTLVMPIPDPIINSAVRVSPQASSVPEIDPTGVEPQLTTLAGEATPNPMTNFVDNFSSTPPEMEIDPTSVELTSPITGMVTTVRARHQSRLQKTALRVPVLPCRHCSLSS